METTIAQLQQSEAQLKQQALSATHATELSKKQKEIEDLQQTIASLRSSQHSYSSISSGYYGSTLGSSQGVVQLGSPQKPGEQSAEVAALRL